MQLHSRPGLGHAQGTPKASLTALAEAIRRNTQALTRLVQEHGDALLPRAMCALYWTLAFQHALAGELAAAAVHFGLGAIHLLDHGSGSGKGKGGVHPLTVAPDLGTSPFG